jgi:hypothetical protein
VGRLSVTWVLCEREESKGGAGGFLKPWRLSGTGQKKEREGGLRAHSREGEGGRERGSGAAVDSSGRPTVAPGGWARAAPLPCEQGRAAGVGDAGG